MGIDSIDYLLCCHVNASAAPVVPVPLDFFDQVTKAADLIMISCGLFWMKQTTVLFAQVLIMLTAFASSCFIGGFFSLFLSLIHYQVNMVTSRRFCLRLANISCHAQLHRRCAFLFTKPLL